MMFGITLVAISITMLLALTRALLGPSVFDRVLAANMFGTKTVLLIAVLNFVSQGPDFLDLAVIYALINFIGVVALLKFVRQAKFEPEVQLDPPEA